MDGNIVINGVKPLDEEWPSVANLYKDHIWKLFDLHRSAVEFILWLWCSEFFFSQQTDFEMHFIISQKTCNIIIILLFLLQLSFNSAGSKYSQNKSKCT